MGGNNSGRRKDPDAKPTVEEYSRWALDIRGLGHALSRPGTIFGYQWSRVGQPTGNRVLCAVYPDRLRLSYKVSRNEGEWEHVSETIQLDTTPCRYGGQRYWFRCSRCHRRTRILYLIKRPYCCRVGLGLAYQSQRELATDRNLERWQSLLRRLAELSQ
jgi:hypothetical protein